MRYWLNKPWPVASWLLPAHIVIDAASDDQWSVIARGYVPPPDATALDDEALALMVQNYGRQALAVSSVFMGWG